MLDTKVCLSAPEAAMKYWRLSDSVELHCVMTRIPRFLQVVRDPANAGTFSSMTHFLVASFGSTTD